MRLILNIIWLIFGGLWLALGYLLASAICFILIITIPFGFAAFRIAAYALWPFGRTLVRKPDAGAGSLIGNVIWFILAGWWLALGHLEPAGLAVGDQLAEGRRPPPRDDGEDGVRHSVFRHPACRSAPATGKLRQCPQRRCLHAVTTHRPPTSTARPGC